MELKDHLIQQVKESMYGLNKMELQQAGEKFLGSHSDPNVVMQVNMVVAELELIRAFNETTGKDGAVIYTFKRKEQ